MDVVASNGRLIEQLEEERKGEMHLRFALRKDEWEAVKRARDAELSVREKIKAQDSDVPFFQRYKIWEEERKSDEEIRRVVRAEIDELRRKERLDEEKLGTERLRRVEGKKAGQSDCAGEMKVTKRLMVFAVVFLLAGRIFCQEAPSSASAKLSGAVANPWTFNLTTDGYIIPNGTRYVDPVFSADRSWLHLEARYNDENLRTGSVWVGYNFSVGKKVELDITPMIGGVFGRTTGIAPGCEASLTYKKLELSVTNEYVFDTKSKSGDFYNTWPQFTYSPWGWLQVGLVAARTRAFQTSLDVQRGFLVGVTHKNLESTVLRFQCWFYGPTVVLEVGGIFEAAGSLLNLI